MLRLLFIGLLQIIRRANETGEDPLSLSDQFCKAYNEDMADLQCLSPTHEPRVSDHIEQIKDMITQVFISSERICLFCFIGIWISQFLSPFCNLAFLSLFFWSAHFHGQAHFCISFAIPGEFF